MSKEGIIPIPKIGTNVLKKIIKLAKKSLLMTIHESDYSTTIYIGGYTKYCIEAQIMKPLSKQDITVGAFNKIRFDVECSLEHDFTRGYDTTMILKLLLTYVHTMYPEVQRMSFNDMSHRTCDDGNDIPLSEMMYVLTGKTWYEKHFEAYLGEDSLKEFIKKEEVFNKQKKEIPWKLMLDSMKNSILPKDESEFKNIYETSETWRDFFNGLFHKLEGITEFCNFVAPWLHTFLTRYFRFQFTSAHYFIPVKDWNISYTISEYQEGGKRFTRKSRKKQMKDYR